MLENNTYRLVMTIMAVITVGIIVTTFKDFLHGYWDTLFEYFKAKKRLY